MYAINPPAVYVHESVARIPAAQARRLNPTVPISLCGETPEMWAALREELGMTPEHYDGTCGPDAVPGHRLLAEPPTRR